MYFLSIELVILGGIHFASKQNDTPITRLHLQGKVARRAIVLCKCLEHTLCKSLEHTLCKFNSNAVLHFRAWYTHLKMPKSHF